MTEQSQDLEGNIQLDNTDEESKAAGGFRPENSGRPGSSASSQGSMSGETFNTLDEPVSETIVSSSNHVTP